MIRLRHAEPTDPKWVIEIVRTYARLTYENQKLAQSIAETDIEPSNDMAVAGCTGQYRAIASWRRQRSSEGQ
jgi:hypothetical protein